MLRVELLGTAHGVLSNSSLFDAFFTRLTVQGHLHSVRELLAAGADTTLKVGMLTGDSFSSPDEEILLRFEELLGSPLRRSSTPGFLPASGPYVTQRWGLSRLLDVTGGGGLLGLRGGVVLVHIFVESLFGKLHLRPAVVTSCQRRGFPPDGSLSSLLLLSLPSSGVPLSSSSALPARRMLTDELLVMISTRRLPRR